MTETQPPYQPQEIRLFEQLTRVGTVDSVWIYPVKSMRGIEIQNEMEVTHHGIVRDRNYAFQKTSSNQDGARAYITARDRNMQDLLLYTPYFKDPNYPEDSEIFVNTPDGNEYKIDNPLLLEELKDKFGKPIEKRKSKLGFPDNQALSIIGLSSVKMLEEELNISVDYRRFRGNININIDEHIQPIENWLQSVVQIGFGSNATRLVIQKTIDRCMMVGLNPDDASNDARILKEIAQQHKNQFGVYAEVLKAGTIKPGDTISMIYIR